VRQEGPLPARVHAARSTSGSIHKHHRGWCPRLSLQLFFAEIKVRFKSALVYEPPQRCVLRDRPEVVEVARRGWRAAAGEGIWEAPWYNGVGDGAL